MKYLFSLLLFFSYVAVAVSQQIPNEIDSLMLQGNYEAALQQIDRKLTKNLNESSSIALKNKKAEILITQGRLSEAESVLESIRPNDSFLNASTLSTRGFLNLMKGRYDLALENLQSAQALFKACNQENSKEGINCLANLASYYVASGKYNQAEEYELRALQFRQAIFNENSEEVAASYNNLGLIYLSTEPDKALAYYEKALNTYQKLYGVTHSKIAIANTNLGLSYNRLELYGDAINYFETAKKIWEKIYPTGHPNLAFVLRNLGSTYAKQKNTSAAIDYYKNALDIYQKAYGSKHPDIASTFNELGSVQLNLNEYDLAIDAFQNSLIANAPAFNSMDSRKNPKKSDYYNPAVLVNTLNLKAQALEEKYRGRTLKLEDLKTALNCLYLSDSLVDDIRYQSSDEGDKLALGSRANEVYEKGVEISLTIAENVLNPKQYVEKAFYFAEKSKSAVLQESIADSQAKSFAGIPAELLEQEKSIKSAITFTTQKLAQKPSAEEDRKLREKLFNSNDQYRKFMKQLEISYPNYFNLKFSQKSYSTDDVQKKLASNAAVISYFLADQTKKIHIFVITKDKFTVTTNSLPSDFDRLLIGLSNSLLYSEPSTYQKSVNVISALLIPKLPSNIAELTIIPSGKLGTLPFETLVSKKLKSPDFKSAEYLIKKYAIGYEFSIGLLLGKKDVEKTSDPSIYLCAPIQFPSNQNLAELPGTEKEVKTIAGLFGNRSTVHLFDEANESMIKSNLLSGFQYLHFATHGIVDQVNPASSQLFLNASQQEDGNLYAGEIYNLTLNSNLAVLSACQTGLGKFSKGEGVIGLSRALVYAGAKNLIVSFWSVADESTAQLMTDFYTNLLGAKDQNFKQALRQSKLKMISDKNYGAPYFWAPFILIGK